MVQASVVAPSWEVQEESVAGKGPSESSVGLKIHSLGISVTMFLAETENGLHISIPMPSPLPSSTHRSPLAASTGHQSILTAEIESEVPSQLKCS